MTTRGAYRVERLDPGRRRVLDLVTYASRVPVIHGLLEVDVNRPRERLASDPDAGTFTTFVLATVGRAVAEHPRINARRAGRRLVVLDEVDVVLTAEHERDGISVPVPHVVRDVDTRTIPELAVEVRRARQRAAGRDPSRRPPTALERLPGPIRGVAARAAMRVPRVSAHLGPAVGVSSLGMFGSGIAWGVPVSPLTLMVTIGSIGSRPVRRGTALDDREILSLTLSFDHTVVDGAPAARFATTLRTMLEDVTVLE